MGQVNLTKDVRNDFITTQVRDATTHYSFGSYSTASQFFQIKAGTRPAISTFTTLSSVDQAGTNLLDWRWIGNSNTGKNLIHDINDCTFGLDQLAYKNAINTGTMSWFAFWTGAFDTLGYLVTGDVGLPGSGAELVVNNLNVTTGDPIKLMGFIFQQPGVYSY